MEREERVADLAGRRGTSKGCEPVAEDQAVPALGRRDPSARLSDRRIRTWWPR